MRFLRRAALLPLLSLLALAGCSPSGLLDTLTPGYGVTRDPVATYAPGPRGMMDIYRPPATPGAAPLPIIVFLYGGNWQTGDRAMYAFAARPLAARGAIVVVPDYRLAPEVAFPAFVQDNAAAVAWTVSHATALGGDPARIFVLGHSAGAYNAAMLALDPAYLAQHGLARSSLAGVIALAGPFDFLPITQPDLQPIFAPVQDGPLSQPITYADGSNPPMLLLAGADDTTVRPGNTERLARRITERGGPVQSRIYPGVAHVGILTALTPLFQRRAPVLDDVEAFIATHRAAAPQARGQEPQPAPR